MKTIEEEFPPVEAFDFWRDIAEPYTRLRARAVEMERALRKADEELVCNQYRPTQWPRPFIAKALART